MRLILFFSLLTEIAFAQIGYNPISQKTWFKDTIQISKGIRIQQGAGIGKVLVSDAEGRGTWQIGGGGGVTGPTGATGSQGAPGLNGLDGINGNDGFDGLNGATGPTGDAGLNGADGLDGINGLDGRNGLDGATGPTGATGADGATGANGVTGATGANGVTGATGTNSYPLLAGGGYVSIAATLTRYNTFGNSATSSATDIYRCYITRSGTLAKLYAQTTTSQPASGSLVFTIMVNGGATGITVTFAASAAAGVQSDLTHTASVVAGDYVSIRMVNNATAAGSATIGAITLELQ